METRIYKITSSDGEDIKEVGEILRRGGLAAIPTETVYGLAGNALDENTAKKIFEAKGRPSDNPLIVHISRFEQWEPLVKHIPASARLLADAFWPGPLTMILPKSDLVPQAVCGKLDTVAVRMPANEIALAIIESSGVPLAAPSANLSGKPSPTCASHVIDDMTGRIDAIVDSGDCNVGVESTVLSLVCDVPRILRPGRVTAEMIAEVVGEVEIDDAVFEKLREGQDVISPGTKYKHYSPDASVVLVRGEFESLEAMRIADSWPTLEEASGKIIALLHPCDVTQEYISNDISLSSQAMFPMLRLEDIDKPYASFILDNEPENAIENNKKTVDEKNLMVRSRADNYPDSSDEQYKLADKCGSHIITTDYPPRAVRPQEHIYDFDGYTVKLLK